MKLLIGCLILVCLLGVGCARSHCNVQIISQTGNISGMSVDTMGDTKMICISPQQYTFQGLCKDEMQSAVIKIANTNDTDIAYTITYTTLSKLHKGFTQAPNEAHNWIKFSDENIRVNAGQSKDVTVSIQVPPNIEVPQQWEFAMEIKDSQGMAVDMRWLMVMADE